MRKICMVGTAPSSIQAPVNDPDWEVWTVNIRMDHTPNVERIIQIHNIRNEPNHEEWRKTLRDMAVDSQLWMFYPEEDLGDVVRFPVQELAGKYGTFFMTSSFAWMMALAIEEMREDAAAGEHCQIGLWGVDMEFGTEYYEQRHGLKHFMELAKQLGIKVTIPVKSGMAYEPIPYPFWEDDPLLMNLTRRMDNMQTMKDKREGIKENAREQLHRANGGIEELEKVLSGETDDIQARIDHIKRLRHSFDDLLPEVEADINWARGVIDATEWSQNFLKP